MGNNYFRELLITIIAIVYYNKAVDLVYLDSQKAFDKVPHERLMLKVNAHGILGGAARWIRTG